MPSFHSYRTEVISDSYWFGMNSLTIVIVSFRMVHVCTEWRDSGHCITSSLIASPRLFVKLFVFDVKAVSLY